MNYYYDANRSWHPFIELLIGGPNQSHKVNFKEPSLSEKGNERELLLAGRQLISVVTETPTAPTKELPSAAGLVHHLNCLEAVLNQREGRRC